MGPMLALMADIHANLEALEACLAHARTAGVREFALLGDLVGYGADPGAVVDRAAALAAEGAVVVRGNHDDAVSGQAAYLNDAALAAIEWTRTVLTVPQKAFLASLPLCVRHDGRCYVHASAAVPERWDYVDGPTAATRAMAAAGTAHTFCGHVHDQRLFFEQAHGRAGEFRPTPGSRVPIPRHRRWLAIAGSVGQSRDGDPRAAYAVVDPSDGITFHRVRYDHVAAAEKMARAGLPQALVYRMRRGI
jgi:diadenosine tetraphosphatase ApaH/serine/threonine PP2A family protein phosphatase